ncbi:peptidase [Litorivicinus sp.]|jgi:repressor LexA|nr:peptidase [Litorivicinus sp.]MDB9862990.1 peptidase [Litorivicinus sp.]MDC1240205.1 peptidase [Litorivicinus sp.]|tara:strand:+ start:5177 stop:5635 length:459 start_codon:yes stop_codon:yes gene_type:complete
MVTVLLPQTKQSAPLEAESFERAFSEGFCAVPILGWVACGQPIEMFPEEATVAVPARLVKKNTYALRVRGDSMRDANILPGDLVIIEQSQAAENGEKVVVRINGKEVTLKTLKVDEDGVKLFPANNSMEPIILNNADVEVLGIVRGVIRDQV